MNDAFVAGHDAPLPLDYAASEKGNMITYSCSDGKNANAYFIKSKGVGNQFIVIFHEWWGLNEYIKREADRYSVDFPNASILAVDLYDGKVAENPAAAQELMTYLMDERARSIINGAISYCGSAQIATIGWCMGGGWSLQAAIMAGNKVNACVVYYGMPEKDPAKLEALNADVYGVFAKKDQWINETIVDQFKTDMAQAKKKLTVKWYDADHAFANPSNPKYNKIAADDARKNVITFLKTKLK